MRDDLRNARAVVQWALITAGIWAWLLLSLGVGHAQSTIVLPAPSSGVSVMSQQVANNTTSVAVKASAGVLYGVQGFANHAALTEVYVKLYNASQGSTTCGSGTPVWRGMIPYNANGGAGFISFGTFGLAFSTAITACVTAGYADSDATAPAASDYLVNYFYK